MEMTQIPAIMPTPTIMKRNSPAKSNNQQQRPGSAERHVFKRISCGRLSLRIYLQVLDQHKTLLWPLYCTALLLTSSKH